MSELIPEALRCSYDLPGNTPTETRRATNLRRAGVSQGREL